MKMRSPGARYGTPFSRAMSYSTPRVTMPCLMGRTEFFSAPFSLVTNVAVSYPFHIFPRKNVCARESMWVDAAPWMQGNATRSVAPDSVADVIAQSAGQGTSDAFSVNAFAD